MATTTINQSKINWDLIVGEMEKYLCGRRLRELAVMSGFVTPTPAFYREFRTITVGAGRQNGKTQWIVDTALPLNRKALIVTINKNFRESVRDRLIEQGTRGQELPIVMSMKDFLNTYLNPDGEVPTFTKIFLDEATAVFQKYKTNSFFEAVDNAAVNTTLIYCVG